MSHAYAIKIFLPGGEPDGLQVIERSNRTRLGLVVPVSLFGKSKWRRELGRTGVRLLLGPPTPPGEVRSAERRLGATS